MSKDKKQGRLSYVKLTAMLKTNVRVQRECYLKLVCLEYPLEQVHLWSRWYVDE